MADDFRLPPFARVVIAVDPSGCSGPEDKRSDEVGIVVAALGEDGLAYVLEDASGRMGPAEWSRLVASLFRKWNADWVIGERNFGGAMVEHTLRTADPNVPYKEVVASRGKARRASPVAALYEPREGQAKGRVRHLQHFPELEDQLCAFSTADYTGERSPDRADAMIWALTDLMVEATPHAGILAFYEQQAQAAALIKPSADHRWKISGNELDADLTVLYRPVNGPSTVYGCQGTKYVVDANDRITVRPEDVAPLLRSGFSKERFL
jgi:hypothetical protein